MQRHARTSPFSGIRTGLEGKASVHRFEQVCIYVYSSIRLINPFCCIVLHGSSYFQQFQELSVC